MTDLNKYSIVKANSKEWARYHAIYRLTYFNEWMSLSFQSDIDRYANVEFCYWVIMDGKKVGGAFIKPNMLKCIFFIPPFCKWDELLEALVHYTESISDNSSEIVVPDVDMSMEECYRNLGFQLNRVDMLMVCPTNEFEVCLESRFKFLAPEEEYFDAMVKLFYETYSSHKLHYIATQSYEFQASSVNTYFNHIKAVNVPSDWSTLIYDTDGERFAGACTVGLVNGLPYILDFLVHPDYQRMGLAAKMMERTLSIQHKDYPAVRPSVTHGNEAVEFYHRMGFISLARKGYMVKA